VGRGVSSTPRFGHSTTPTELLATGNSVLRRAREVGVAGDVEALQLALASAIGVYDQILATAPASVRPLVEGAGGNSMKLARAILEAV